MKPIIFQPYQNEAKKPFSALQEEVLRLKKERNAVILAHNYVANEIQEVADFIGDSLGLSYCARDAKADVIVFSQKLGALADIMGISKLVRAVGAINILAFAAVKIALLILALSGTIGLAPAVLVDLAVVLGSQLNALRVISFNIENRRKYR